MKKIMMTTAMALALTLGVGTAAYAWHGQAEHSNSQYHGSARHSQGTQTQQQGQEPSFNQHGGGHEQAQNNSAIHESEKNDPRHSDNSGHR